MSLPVWGYRSQKCDKLIDRIEAGVIVSLVLIGEFQFRKFDDFIPEIDCCHKAKRTVISDLEEVYFLLF